MADQSLAEKADALVAEVFASWNIYTTVLAAILLVYLVYPLFVPKDPDIHPYLLARQAGASPIRQNGQSPVYRAIEIPYGYPLRAGLGVKDPGAPRWSSGREGDLRDIWRRAMQGPLKDDGTPDGPKGKVITVLGREKVNEHTLDDLTRGINAIGAYIRKLGATKVGICLANSVEMLQSIFAAAFYGSSSALIPYGLEGSQVYDLMKQTSPEVLIAEAGTLDVEKVVASCPSLKHIIWVTKAGSEHMDWNEVPEGIGGRLGVSVWKDLIEEHGSNSEVPPYDKDAEEVPPVTTFWPAAVGKFEQVEYSSKNIIAAVAGLNAALPRNHRLSSKDLVLPLAPLWLSYSLCFTFAALFNHASIALNSVAGDSVNVELASEGILPTVIVCSTFTALTLHTKTADLASGAWAPVTRWSKIRSLKSGIMPDSRPKDLAKSPLSNLRMLMISHRAGDMASPTLSSSILTDLRLYAGVQIGYALTAGPVAGAVSQTNVLDYRDKATENHFGAPLSCVEVFVTGEEEQLEAGQLRGKLVVRGPSVVGGEAKLEIDATINEDHTLSLA